MLSLIREQAPSPHRFLPGRRNPSPTKESKHGHLTLRKQVHIAHGDGFADATAQATSKPSKLARGRPTIEGDGFESTPKPAKDRSQARQFAQAPKFSAGRPTQFQQTERSPSPQKRNLVEALRAIGRPNEDVEDTTGPFHVDEAMLDAEQYEAMPTTERATAWIDELPHSPKRRRLEDVASPACPPVFKHPTTPASALRGPQFSRASSVASSVAEDSSISNSRRPAFLRPSLAPPEQHEPLPEVFSPHRRGEKFVPGGMAATLQQWVVERGQEAMASRRGQGYLQGEDHVLQVEVADVNGTGPLLVSGRSEAGRDLRVLLAVDAKKGSVELRRGCRVGIRAPTWDIEVDGQSWGVGVDWKVLS